MEKERKVYYLSNNVFVTYMISKGVEFCEEKMEKGEFDGKLRFSFPFYTDDIHFKETREEIRRAKEEHFRLEFPEISNDDQLSFKDASDIRFEAIRKKFPKKGGR